jgi:hypothetical protein
LEKEEILKGTDKVYNIISAPADRFVPLGTESSWEGLSEREQQAIDLWAESICEKVDSDSRRIIMENFGGWERTVVELASGDETRIATELAYIRKQKPGK